MVDSDDFLTEICHVNGRKNERPGDGIGWRRQLVVDQGQILLSYRINRGFRRERLPRREYVRTSRGGRGGNIGAQTNIHRKNTLAHVQVRCRAAERRIATVLALFFGKEKIGSRQFLYRPSAFAKPGNIDRTTDSKSVVVVSERRALGFAVGVSAESRTRDAV